MISERTTETLEHANAIFARLDEREGAAHEAAQRERQRLNAGFGRAVSRLGIAAGMVGVPAAYINTVIAPLGTIGWLAAAGVGAVLGALLMAFRRREIAAPNLKADLPNREMVEQFDSYLYRARRALPAPAKAQLDLISAQLPLLREVMERVPDLDLNAQDARRLMSVHLPNLIDRYVHVPSMYRKRPDDEGVTVDARLVEALAAGRGALEDLGEKLARGDLAAFETQGRFMQSRYAGDDDKLPLSSTKPAPEDRRLPK